MALQFLDAIAGDRGRDALVAARRRKGTEFDHANEDAYIIEIGHDSFYHIGVRSKVGGHLLDFFERLGDSPGFPGK